VKKIGLIKEEIKEEIKASHIFGRYNPIYVITKDNEIQVTMGDSEYKRKLELSHNIIKEINTIQFKNKNYEEIEKIIDNIFTKEEEELIMQISNLK
jgi:hypothetical protein